jgi:rhamnogalacturonan acetylesterase
MKWHQYLLAAVPSVMAATVHLAGDSTMVDTLSSVEKGWGGYLPSYITLAVKNSAIAGRSARSFTREGRFTTMANAVQSGDYVIIEFGHNDGGSLNSGTDNGRTPCNPVDGNYAVTCQTTYK